MRAACFLGERGKAFAARSPSALERLLQHGRLLPGELRHQPTLQPGRLLLLQPRAGCGGGDGDIWGLAPASCRGNGPGESSTHGQHRGAESLC